MQLTLSTLFRSNGLKFTHNPHREDPECLPLLRQQTRGKARRRTRRRKKKKKGKEKMEEEDEPRRRRRKWKK